MSAMFPVGRFSTASLTLRLPKVNFVPSTRKPSCVGKRLCSHSAGPERCIVLWMVMHVRLRWKFSMKPRPGHTSQKHRDYSPFGDRLEMNLVLLLPKNSAVV